MGIMPKTKKASLPLGEEGPEKGQRTELFIVGKRCSGIVRDQYQSNGVWWMMLDEFFYYDDALTGKKDKRDGYRVRIKDISAYGPALEGC